MTELDTIRSYYEKVVSANFPHAVDPDDGRERLKAVSIRGCHGNSKNLLFFSVECENGMVERIGYDCQYCDVTMYVTAELICEFAPGRSPDEIEKLSDDELLEALGGTSKKVLRQARISIELLVEGLREGG